MAALIVVVLTWLTANGYLLARDPEARKQRLLRRNPMIGVQVLADAAREGVATTDSSGTAAMVRAQMGGRGSGRLILVMLVTGPLVLTDWNPVVVIAMAVVLTMAVGSRMRWLIRLRGHEDLSWEPSAHARVGDALAYAAKAAVLAPGFWLVWRGGQELQGGNWPSGCLAVALGIVTIRIAHLPARAVLRRLAPTSASTGAGFGLDADGTSVLLLRSFADDAFRIRSFMSAQGPANAALPATFERLEELLALALLLKGRLVAIGRPGEPLPELGATRTYYPDSDWQQAVRVTAQRASLIVLVAGNTEGLSWEIDQLRRWDLLGKCLFVLPPEIDDEIARQRLARLLLHLTGEERVPACWVPQLWIAVAVEDGLPVHILSDGRDYAAYLGVVLSYVLTREGQHARRAEGIGASDGAIRSERAMDAIDRGELGLAAQAKILRDVQAGSARIHAGELDAGLSLYNRAQVTAQGSGALGAVPVVLSNFAEDLVEQGQWVDAAAAYDEVIVLCKQDFAPFKIAGKLVRSADLLVEAQEARAILASSHGVGNAREAYEAWYQGLVEGRFWEHAGVAACIIGDNARSMQEAALWYQRAVRHASDTGAVLIKGTAEYGWGLAASRFADPLAAREHLEQAIELRQRAGLTHEVAEARDALARLGTVPLVAPGATDHALRSWRDDGSLQTQPGQPTPASSVSPLAPVFRGVPPTAWELGWAGAQQAPDKAERPSGIRDDGPLSASARLQIRLMVLAGANVRQQPRLGHVGRALFHQAEAKAVKAGAVGAALVCRSLEADALRKTGRPEAAEEILRGILNEAEPGWIELGDQPVTGTELFDSLWEIITEMALDRGDFVVAMESESHRRDLAPRLRDPKAGRLSAARLGFVHARAGHFDAARRWFQRAEEEGGLEYQSELMWAAACLAAGAIDEAEEHYARAGGRLDFAGAFGLRADIAAARGSLDEARDLYRQALGSALEYDLDSRNSELARSRLKGL